MVSPQASPLPLRKLLTVLALVLLAHAMLLAGATSVWQVPPSVPNSNPFSTRAIEAPVAAAPPAAQPSPPPAPAPVAKPAPVKQPAPTPSPQNTPSNPPPLPLAAPSTGSTAPDVAAKPNLPDTPTETAIVTSTTTSTLASTEPATTPSPQESNALNPATRGLAMIFPNSGKFSYIASLLSNGQPQSGSGNLEWTTDGRDYQLRLESSALFITVLTQTSIGTLSAEGLLPDRFADKRLRRSEKATHFRRDSGRIVFSGNSNSAALQRGAQDRLSVLMQLAAVAAGNPALFMRDTQLAIQVAGTEEADTWIFSVEGTEALELPAGKTNAVRVVRNPRKDFDAKLELWLAPSVGYLPVRIRQTETNGNLFELQLRSPALR